MVGCFKASELQRFKKIILHFANVCSNKVYVLYFQFKILPIFMLLADAEAATADDRAWRDASFKTALQQPS